jgi:hypothetical protein
MMMMMTGRKRKKSSGRKIIYEWYDGYDVTAESWIMNVEMTTPPTTVFDATPTTTMTT